VKQVVEKFRMDFFGIGTTRSGTTWIYNMLKEHPDVCVSSKKEIGFFYVDKAYKKGINFYKSYFCDCKKTRGEVYPFYIHFKKAADRMYGMYPNAKIFLSWRDPVERMYSHYRKHYLHGDLTETFDEAIRKYPEKYVDFGYCKEGLDYYKKLFGDNNVLVLQFNELKTNPRGFIQKIYG